MPWDVANVGTATGTLHNVTRWVIPNSFQCSMSRSSRGAARRPKRPRRTGIQINSSCNCASVNWQSWSRLPQLKLATTSTMRPAAVALGRLAAVLVLAVLALAFAFGTSRTTRSHPLPARRWSSRTAPRSPATLRAVLVGRPHGARAAPAAGLQPRRRPRRRRKPHVVPMAAVLASHGQGP